MRFISPDVDFSGKDAETGWVIDDLGNGTRGPIEVKYYPNQHVFEIELKGKLETLVATSEGVYHPSYIYKTLDEALFALSITRVIS